MATNQTGIAITIKAFLPIGKNLDQQLAALTLVKTAHETSDYAPLLAAAKIDEVKTEQKTRRVEDRDMSAEALYTSRETASGRMTYTEGAVDGEGNGGAPADTPAIVQTTVFPPDTALDPAGDLPIATDADIPAFLKGKKKAA